mmetsp:Transcript_63905/g.152419  ORF Transcript_63905/g.152419 Transcript_63905/m.152419 type:complete len:231 (-) Transcript_63905:499-1191(-)
MGRSNVTLPLCWSTRTFCLNSTFFNAARHGLSGGSSLSKRACMLFTVVSNLCRCCRSSARAACSCCIWDINCWICGASCWLPAILLSGCCGGPPTDRNRTGIAGVPGAAVRDVLVRVAMGVAVAFVPGCATTICAACGCGEGDRVLNCTLPGGRGVPASAGGAAMMGPCAHGPVLGMVGGVAAAKLTADGKALALAVCGGVTNAMCPEDCREGDRARSCTLPAGTAGATS